MARLRLDREMVRRGLVQSRHRAQQLIAEGRVTVGGAPAPKAARQTSPAEPIEVVEGERPFASRAGAKLEAALEAFGVDVGGRRVLDAGSSTGGFTDCLLRRGAAQVVAVDVGRGLMLDRLANHRAVELREGVNVRNLTPADVQPPVDLVVADLSFISLRTVLGTLLDLGGPEPELITLVKPQFEAGRREVNRGRGVIRDPEVWSRVLEEVAGTALSLGAGIMGLMLSPVTGTKGNREFLMHVRRDGSEGPGPEPSVSRLIATAVASATGTGAT